MQNVLRNVSITQKIYHMNNWSVSAKIKLQHDTIDKLGRPIAAVRARVEKPEIITLQNAKRMMDSDWATSQNISSSDSNSGSITTTLNHAASVGSRLTQEQNPNWFQVGFGEID